jgi:hypothetical protein
MPMEKPPDFDAFFRLLRDAVIVSFVVLLLGWAIVEALS